MSLSELFVWPGAIAFLLLVPLVWLGLRVLDRARARRLVRVVGQRAPTLVAELGVRQRRVRRLLTTAGLSFALIAVMQPSWGLDVRRVEQRSRNLVLCLDVSRSMLARDVAAMRASDPAPNRLQRAKREIRALAERTHGDRLGLVAFAGEAHLGVPLTRDMDTFADLVDMADPLSVRRGGTDLGAALEAALTALEEQTGDHEAVVLITDGEDHEQRGLRVAKECRRLNITVHCMGIGSALGSKIAVQDGRVESFLRDRSGQEVISAMDAAGLRRIAETTGGGFVDASSAPLPLVELYETRIRNVAPHTFAAGERRERKNRFQWPLLVAFVVWMLELCLTDRRRR